MATKKQREALVEALEEKFPQQVMYFFPLDDPYTKNTDFSVDESFYFEDIVKVVEKLGWKPVPKEKK